jgi:site-specific DNA-methyltransferase (adenine-specific)
MRVEVVTGDCREMADHYGPFDMLIADPPYGQTSLPWDWRVDGWERAALSMLKPNGSIWVFGSMRLLGEGWSKITDAGWKYAQDVVWEKHNGTNLANDRFRRVHEHVVQFYKRDAAWSKVWNEVQTTPDATARTVRKKGRPAQWIGATGETVYKSEDGGPRIMRSVLPVRSCHGHAIHPTEKPVALLDVLIRTSCPPGAYVGDLFAGSGAAGEAARSAGRNYIGFEIDAAMAQKARDRLSSQLALTN